MFCYYLFGKLCLSPSTIDVADHFSLNQCRTEDITLKETLGSNFHTVGIGNSLEESREMIFTFSVQHCLCLYLFSINLQERKPTLIKGFLIKVSVSKATALVMKKCRLTSLVKFIIPLMTFTLYYHKITRCSKIVSVCHR